jgi:hypothetical protein
LVVSGIAHSLNDGKYKIDAERNERPDNDLEHPRRMSCHDGAGKVGQAAPPAALVCFIYKLIAVAAIAM